MAKKKSGSTKKTAKPAKAKAKKPTVQQPPEYAALLKREEDMRRLGQQIRAKEDDRAEQEKAVDEADAKRTTEKRALTVIENELEALHDDLAKLAVGGFTERLPFKEPVKSDAKPAPLSNADAWRDVKLADVWQEVGGAAKLLTALRDGPVKKGNGAAGIVTMGQLADFQKPSPGYDRGRDLTSIKGIGAEGEKEIGEITLRWWHLHADMNPNAKKPTPPAPVLKWGANQDTPDELWAANTAGIENEADLLAEFVITPASGTFSVLNSDKILLPLSFPDEFKTIEEAKAWCEARNAELVKDEEAHRGKGKLETAAA